MPKKADYPDSTIRLAATLYHVDGLGQAEVARMVGVSQTKVSRLLAVAQRRGIVRVTVEEYQPRHDGLERELRARFGLHAAAVINVPRPGDREMARQSVGHFGAAFVASQIPSSGVLAIGGGRSLAEVVQRFRPATGRRLTIVQAMGSIDSTLSAVDALELGRTLMKLWQGEFLTLSTPAFAPDQRTRDAFVASAQIQFVQRRLRQADAALVGVGSLERSVYQERGVISEAEISHLKSQGAVGEICGRFFDKQGRECRSGWRDRVISIELAHLRKIPHVIGVAAGAERAPAVAAALRGGLLKSLLIDEAGADALLRH